MLHLGKTLLLPRRGPRCSLSQKQHASSCYD